MVDKLRARFRDADGDGLGRFRICDYGAGDVACVTHAASVDRSSGTLTIAADTTGAGRVHAE